MIVIKIILVLLIAMAGIWCIIRNSQLSEKIQQYYIKTSKKTYGNGHIWEGLWIRNLFRIIAIGIGIILLLAAYPLVFGPVVVYLPGA